MSDLTPLMQQYFSIKEKYQEEILFFRLGDFYEMFNQDAKTVARELEITLTSRNKGGGEETPMAGVPCKSAESYIAQLIEKGFRVAICEQVEDPSASSGLVKREVVRVITPGTIINNDLLEDKDNNYLAAITGAKQGYGFAVVDVSTGEFVTTQLKGANQGNKVIDELSRINPSEILLTEQVQATAKITDFIAQQLTSSVTEIEDFAQDEAYRLLTDHFNVANLEGFGCQDLPLATKAAGAILDFLLETQKRSLHHINQLATYSTTDYMVLDANTRRNLELTKTMREKKKRGSLLWVLDETVTAIGGRMLKKWVEQPLLELDRIQNRLAGVEEITENIFVKEELKELLKEVYDIERLLGKITYGSANARDLISLKSSLDILPDVEQALTQFKTPKLNHLQDRLDKLEEIAELIDKAIKDDPASTLTEGDIIKKGYDEELDELLEAMEHGKQWILDLQQQERERTGISSLKVGHNKVHGYYIEVTKANLDAVPDDYVRKQTLTNSERYITPELKEKESTILGAQENSKELEYELFIKVRDQVAAQTERIQQSATVLAELDALLSLADVALNNDYTKPEVTTGEQINIDSGFHPVVEEMMEEEVFVPNDTYLDQAEDRFCIITGPNMSGKSTYMRQVALITLLAQIGSFVPAAKAQLGIVDRIFTRVGASDDLTTGQSTFMVEMNEVANILNNATEQSLIILDEVGRGTSTYDGLSIAWAVTEYIANPTQIGAKSLFATHYHELTELEDTLPGVKNYNVAVEEEGDEVVFLHKIVPGEADQSYGIEVAELAGVPSSVIDRSQEILAQLEEKEEEKVKETVVDSNPVTEQEELEEANRVEEESQLSLFNSQSSPVVEELSKLDIMSLTPLEAMNKLHHLQQQAKEERE
ncbi:DNA mismatch repair protein MutS [Halanaerobaculum tunisiense]